MSKNYDLAPIIERTVINVYYRDRSKQRRFHRTRSLNQLRKMSLDRGCMMSR